MDWRTFYVLCMFLSNGAHLARFYFYSCHINRNDSNLSQNRFFYNRFSYPTYLHLSSLKVPLTYKLRVSHFPSNKMNGNAFFFSFFLRRQKPNDTGYILLKRWVSGIEHTFQPVLSCSMFLSLHSLFRCSRCTRTNSPKTVECWHRKERGRNTPAIGSSGCAESVPSHNVPSYYRGDYISIKITQNVESRCAAKCSLSSVSSSLYDTSLPRQLVSETDWRPNSGQNR